MGLRGPAPAPKLKVVREGAKVRGIHENQVVAPPKAPSEPLWSEYFGRKRKLAERASSQWRLVVPALDAMGVLAEVDLSVLELMCVSYARWQEVEANISKLGTSIEGRTGPVRNPDVVVSTGLMNTIRACQVQLGLTPAARSRMQAPKVDEGGSDDDPWTV